MKHVYVLLLAVLALGACNSTGEKTEGESKKKPNGDTTEVAEEKEPLPYDTLLTDMSRFIAGLPVEKYFTDLQAAASYEEHKKFTDTSWVKAKKKMLDPIGKWCKEKKITDASDSALCFYPLSGPDFLFGNTFFPHASHYVMMGLEPNGSLTDFRQLKPEQIERYLSGVRESMKYLNKAGYFVTSHMSGDFTRAHLNGMSHMMLLMMARTGHKIVAVDHIKVDTAGNVSVVQEKKLPAPDLAGVRITFLSPDGTKEKTAFYFSANVRDEEIQKLPGFVPFVESFGKRVSYMKSASCVLVNTDFSVVRNLVLQSDKVVQDDTGVPYHYFISDSTLEVSLYGTYTQVINDLKWCFQTDLKKAIAASPENKPLPFRISYNGNYGEGMLLFAKRKSH